MIQIQNMVSFFTYVLAPACTAITVMFLPAIIELKKPRDAGPRIINYSLAQSGLFSLGLLADIEEKFENKLNLKAVIFPGRLFDIET